MIQVQDAHHTADAFRIRHLKDQVVQFSFGPTHVCMTLDAALDFQFRLAAFLAWSELVDYTREEKEGEDARFFESRKNLVDLTQFVHQRRKEQDV